MVAGPTATEADGDPAGEAAADVVAGEGSGDGTLVPVIGDSSFTTSLATGDALLAEIVGTAGDETGEPDSWATGEATGDSAATGLAASGLPAAGLAAAGLLAAVGVTAGAFVAGARVTVGSAFLSSLPQAASTTAASTPTTANSDIRLSIDTVLRPVATAHVRGATALPMIHDRCADPFNRLVTQEDRRRSAQPGRREPRAL